MFGAFISQYQSSRLFSWGVYMRLCRFRCGMICSFLSSHLSEPFYGSHPRSIILRGSSELLYGRGIFVCERVLSRAYAAAIRITANAWREALPRANTFGGRDLSLGRPCVSSHLVTSWNSRPSLFTPLRPRILLSSRIVPKSMFRYWPLQGYRWTISSFVVNA